jgi:hypothetical protein
MAKAPKEYRWKIYDAQIEIGMSTTFLGTVTAPDEETALRRALVELKIDTKIHRRVVALRQG